MRLSGRQVCLVSGTDEHGQKVEQSAARQSLHPQEFVNAVSQNFRDMNQLLNLQIDRFVRTTDASHKAAVQVRMIREPAKAPVGWCARETRL